MRIYCVAHASNASGKAYVLSWHTAEGRKVQKFANPDAAIAEAKIKAGKLATGQTEAAGMTSADREELHAARALALAGKTPLLAALQEWLKARDLTEGNFLPACEAWASRNTIRFERITVPEAIKRFTAAKTRAGVDVACSYNKILPALKEHAGDRMLDTLSARELQAWLDHRYPHPVSRNTARKRIVALWRWARKQGYLPRDTQTEAEQTEFAQEETAKIGVINSETFGKLLRFFADKHPEYLPALAVAGFCGLRRAEIHDQQWADVNLERGFVRVSKAKRNTPARRLVPLCPAAAEWLLLCPDRTDALCGNLAIDRIRHIAREAKDEAGTPLFPDVPDNAFRHSFISHRVAATGNVAETALEAGNSPNVIFRHYRELFTKEEGQAWFDVRPAGTVVAMPEQGKAAS